MNCLESNTWSRKGLVHLFCQSPLKRRSQPSFLQNTPDPLCRPRGQNADNLFFILRLVSRYFDLQGCQIFLGTWYQNRKNVPNGHKMYQMDTKCTKWTQNVPNGHKMYQMDTKCTKWTQNVPYGYKISQMSVKYSTSAYPKSTFSNLRPSKITQMGIFGLKTNHLATLILSALLCAVTEPRLRSRLSCYFIPSCGLGSLLNWRKFVNFWILLFRIDQTFRWAKVFGTQNSLKSFPSSKPTKITFQDRHQNLFLTREQYCQMLYFQTKIINLGKFWRALEWKKLVYFMVIWQFWYILWPFCNIILVYFPPFWFT
jgi:hypothetical protein